LLVVGNGAKTGEKISANEYEILEDNLNKTFGKYTIKNKWTAEDVISLDKIPYIGKYSNFVPNMYVATGYKKWGITTSNIAAQIISDKILNNNNKYSNIFTSNRLNLIKNKTEMKNMIVTTTTSLTRSKENTKVCTHLGCKMYFNETTNTWDCPCHGSRFTKDGKLIDGPSVKTLL
jgi:Rieske Fe-S protein